MEDGRRHKFSLFRGVQDKLTQNYITNGTIKHIRPRAFLKMFAYESFYSTINDLGEGIISVIKAFRRRNIIE